MYDHDEHQHLAALRTEALELASQGMTADFIKAELSIPRSRRTVQRWIHQAYGTRPSRRSVTARNPLRDRVVAYMEASGLDEHYCYLGHRSVRPCAIRELRKDDDLGSLVFVCEHEVVVSDF